MVTVANNIKNKISSTLFSLRNRKNYLTIERENIFLLVGFVFSFILCQNLIEICFYKVKGEHADYLHHKYRKDFFFKASERERLKIVLNVFAQLLLTITQDYFVGLDLKFTVFL